MAGAGVIFVGHGNRVTGETKGDGEFAQALASLADCYVNDAFGTAHRAHASMVGVADCLTDKAAGYLLLEEVRYLRDSLTDPKRPFVVILGGAKVSDKIGVMESLLGKVDALLVGGAMANTFLAARGLAVGKSLCENDKLALARSLMAAAEESQIGRASCRERV